jgi:hypothetical protein
MHRNVRQILDHCTIDRVGENPALGEVTNRFLEVHIAGTFDPDELYVIYASEFLQTARNEFSLKLCKWTSTRGKTNDLRAHRPIADTMTRTDTVA